MISSASEVTLIYIWVRLTTGKSLQLTEKHHIISKFPETYRETSNKRHKIPTLKCFLSRLEAVFAQSIEARCLIENED